MPAIVKEENCDGCGTCQENCPTDAIHVQAEPKKMARVTPENCIDCNLCQDNCPQNAIEMKV